MFHSRFELALVRVNSIRVLLEVEIDIWIFHFQGRRPR